MTPDWSTLEKRIRWLMHDQGADQRVFGREADLSESAIGGFFFRAKKDPDASMQGDALAKIVLRWKVTPAWLLLGVGSPYENKPVDAFLPRFNQAENWSGVVATLNAMATSPPSWAVAVVGSWPAPPAGVPISVGLVDELARVVMRFYPAPALDTVYKPDIESGTRIKPLRAPETDDEFEPTTPRVRAASPRAGSRR